MKYSPEITNLASKPDGDTLTKNITKKVYSTTTLRAYTNCRVSISYKKIYNITKQTLCTTLTTYWQSIWELQQTNAVYQASGARFLPRKWVKHFGRLSYKHINLMKRARENFRHINLVNQAINMNV